LSGRPAEPATDVYALGAVLYEMLAGHRPYSASSPEDLVAQQQRPPAPVADAPPALVALAAGALTPDPSARPTAAAFARSLRGWLAGQADAETRAVATVPQTSMVRQVVAPASHVATIGIRRFSPIALIAAGLLVVALVAGAVAFSSGFLALPGATPTPTPGPTFVPPSPTLPATLAPVQNGGGSGSGGGGSGGGGGGNNGNHGGGNGHGKGPGH
jgi:uncharacterized membrane protein YgcG